MAQLYNNVVCLAQLIIELLGAVSCLISQVTRAESISTSDLNNTAIINLIILEYLVQLIYSRSISSTSEITFLK